MTPLDHLDRDQDALKNENPPAQLFSTRDGKGVDGRSSTAIDAKDGVSCCACDGVGSRGDGVADDTDRPGDGLQTADDLREGAS